MAAPAIPAADPAWSATRKMLYNEVCMKLRAWDAGDLAQLLEQLEHNASGGFVQPAHAAAYGGALPLAVPTAVAPPVPVPVGGVKRARAAAPPPREAAEAEQRAVADFIARNQLDERCAAGLWELTPPQRQGVLERGDVTKARNPSAVVLMRVRDAARLLAPDGSSYSAEEAAGCGPGLLHPGDWNCALCTNLNFGRRAQCHRCGAPRGDGAAAIGGIPPPPPPPPPPVAAVPTAVPTGVVQVAKMSSGYGNPTADGQISAGQFDWVCTECGLSNWPRRTNCNRCGTGRTNSGDAQPAKQASEELEAFCQRNNLDERTRSVLCELDHYQLNGIISRGDCTAARNPNAVIMGRVREQYGTIREAAHAR